MNKKRQEQILRFIIIVTTVSFVFVVAHEYFERMGGNDESLVFGVGLCFVGGIYTGRFISHLWIDKGSQIPNRLLMTLVVLILVFCFIAAGAASSLRNHVSVFPVLVFFLSWFSLNLLGGMFIKLVKTKITAQIKTAEITASHSQTELHFLQSQLSPHFLFNTLNNLYGISITQHEKIPTLLLKLSELLRYSVYDAKDTYVPLKDELGYLNNYIDFEKIRIGERLGLTVELDEISDSKIKIAPMLLIVFVENAFKHSKNTSHPKIHIYIGLKIWANSILFSIKNTHKNGANANSNFPEIGGLGLDNVKKRLELLYPNAYDLNIEEDDDFYEVMLRVKVK
ncbi:MAG: histidine kinase [Saprospiraceae bacterium]